MDEVCKQLAETIDKAVEDQQTPRHSKRLGPSQLGNECMRATWYRFRWYKKVVFNGRMLRLFDRGNREEAVFIKLLRDAGWTVNDRGHRGRQHSFVSLDGHMFGYLDALVTPPKWFPIQEQMVAEFKTSNKDQFAKFLKDDCAETNPKYYAQAQLYMAAYDKKFCLFIVVNKDNDDLYIEILERDEGKVGELMTSAELIIRSQTPPPKIADSPTFYKCRFCDYKSVCHLKAAPEKNCRSCRWSKPAPDGRWACGKHDDVVIPDNAVGTEQSCWEEQLS